MFDLQAAFKFALQFKTRPMQIYRPGTSPTMYSVNIATSNYSRNLEAQGDIVIDGLEFVVAKDEIEDWDIYPLVRGDKIVDPELGTNTITEVNPMIANGMIVGFRMRTS